MYTYTLSPTEFKNKDDHRSFATSRYYARLKAIDAGYNQYELVSIDGSYSSGAFRV